jgi:2,3-bisphosphoglycerate-dependent phosphoglycerate mutase
MRPIVAHGNSLRALVKHLDDISDTDVVGLNIPTGQPLVHLLDANFKGQSHRSLADPKAIAAAMQQVAGQGEAAR